MKKWEFKTLLRKIDLTKTWTFLYDGKCTDPMSSRYWVSHMSNYQFSMYCSETKEEIILESKKTSKDHFSLEEFLKKKYTSWAIEFKNKEMK